METPPFRGVIGDDWRDSTPWWPTGTTPPPGAPNVVLVVLDDVGFAQLGCYGSDIATPTIDSLAAGGLRLTNFHTTALCSPTRACLLTGRNHHRNGLGRVADLAVGFPGYNGEVPKENGFLSEILGQHGYATYAVGKWHLTPDDETNMAAPRNSWPLARGSTAGTASTGGRRTSSYRPSTTTTTRWVPPTSVEDGYTSSADLADQAIAQLADLRAVDGTGPSSCTSAPVPATPPITPPGSGSTATRATSTRAGTAGARRPSPANWPRAYWPRAPRWLPARRGSPLGTTLGRASGRWRPGSWSALPRSCPTPTPSWARVLGVSGGDRVTARTPWSSWCPTTGPAPRAGPDGSINDNRLQNFDAAGPHELSRRIDELGGPRAHNNYPWGWTMAGNTPFKRWKREVHEGGVADPCIVNWPARIVAGDGIRRQFTHAVDILPTVLELAGIGPPETIVYVPQTPIDGISFAPLLEAGGADAPEHRSTQYFEMFGSRALYHEGWKAVTFKPIGPLYNDGLNWNAPSVRTAGSCTTWPRTRPSSMTWPVRSPTGWPPWSSGGGRRPGATRCCLSTTGSCTPCSTPSRTAGRPVSSPPTTRGPHRFPRRWRPT